MTLPLGWSRGSQELYLDEVTGEGIPSLTISTHEYAFERSNRCDLPIAALDSMGPQDAVASGRNAPPGNAYAGDRPDLDAFLATEPPRSAIGQCLTAPIDVRLITTGFVENGRAVVVLVAIGVDAPPGIVDEVRTVISSLRATPQ